MKRIRKLLKCQACDSIAVKFKVADKFILNKQKREAHPSIAGEPSDTKLEHKYYKQYLI